MPKIQSYSIVTPSPSDLIVVTDASDNNSTKNIRVDSLSSATAVKSYGSFYNPLPGTVTVSVANTWYKVQINLDEGTNDNIVLDGTGYQVLNEATSGFDCLITAVLTLSAGNNDIVHCSIAKNDVRLAPSEQDIGLVGTDDTQIVMTVIEPLVLNDVISLWVKNETSTNDFNIKHISLVLNQVN